MTYTLVWLPDALADLERLYAFIEPHSAEAAGRAINTLIEAAQSLEQFPEKGRPWELEWETEDGFRELPVWFGAKDYVIRYRLHQDKIIIVRVWHGLEER